MTNNNPFRSGTKNATIFSTTAPFRNPYQGEQPRWLFVCSAGLLRSPTGATMASRRGINARSCGSNLHYALIPCSANLVAWADRIVFVNSENYEEVVHNFSEYQLQLDLVESKAIVLDIPDQFEYMHPQLQYSFETQLFSPYGFNEN